MLSASSLLPPSSPPQFPFLVKGREDAARAGRNLLETRLLRMGERPLDMQEDWRRSRVGLLAWGQRSEVSTYRSPGRRTYLRGEVRENQQRGVRWRMEKHKRETGKRRYQTGQRRCQRGENK